MSMKLITGRQLDNVLQLPDRQLLMLTGVQGRGSKSRQYCAQS